MEIWKDIIELDGLYKISNRGVVYRKTRVVLGKRTFTLKESLKHCQDNGKGYKQLYVQINNNRKLFYIHRLVAKYFVDNPFNLEEVNHLDGDKSNNYYKNLEWCSKKQNLKHAVDTGLFKSKGEDNTKSKLTEKNVLAIRRLNAINPKFNKSKVAKKLKVRDSTIHKIIKNQRWTHV